MLSSRKQNLKEVYIRYLPYLALFVVLAAGTYAVSASTYTFYNKDGKVLTALQASALLAKSNNSATVIKCVPVQLSPNTGNFVNRKN